MIFFENSVFSIDTDMMINYNVMIWETFKWAAWVKKENNYAT